MEEAVLRSKKLAEDTWVIYIGNTTAYLIAGDERGMMIDSGDTPCALREYCESLCGKPVREVANTHGHFDHTGGNGYFETAYMGRLAAEICRVPNGDQNAADFPMDYDIVVVDDGFKIDLGNREIETFVLDGHSPDSTAYLDRKMRLLFAGDNLCKAPMMRYKCPDPQPSMLRYAINLSKLMARREDFDWILRGHEDALLPGDLLNHTLICALRAAELDCDPAPARQHGPHPEKGGKKKGPPPSIDPATAGYVEYKDAHLFFDKRYAADLTRYDVAQGT